MIIIMLAIINILHFFVLLIFKLICDIVALDKNISLSIIDIGFILSIVLCIGGMALVISGMVGIGMDLVISGMVGIGGMVGISGMVGIGSMVGISGIGISGMVGIGSMVGISGMVGIGSTVGISGMVGIGMALVISSMVGIGGMVFGIVIFILSFISNNIISFSLELII